MAIIGIEKEYSFIPIQFRMKKAVAFSVENRIETYGEVEKSPFAKNI
ncbi:hypothetical protein [Heyndrickxia sporothermodurans]